MIGRLRGTLAEKQPPHLILDVNGLGYELEVPMTTLYSLPSVGEEGVRRHIELGVKGPPGAIDEAFARLEAGARELGGEVQR